MSLCSPGERERVDVFLSVALPVVFFYCAVIVAAMDLWEEFIVHGG